MTASASRTLFRAQRFDLIVHCAAQPSHDKARDIPILDFEVNALGTVNLLEATRLHCPEAVFILLSTNKVYGDAPNEVPLKELETVGNMRAQKITTASPRIAELIRPCIRFLVLPKHLRT